MGNCPLCSKNIIKLVIDLENPREIGEKRLSYVKCENCEIVFIQPRPSNEELERIYSKVEYFDNLSKPPESKIIKKILGIRLYEDYDSYLLRVTKLKQGKILDIGCGNGEFLLHMKNRGFKVYGFDKSQQALKKTGELIGAENLTIGDFLKSPFKENFFDVVTLWQVLEHVINPIEYLKKIKNILKPGGFLLLEVPNFNSLAFRVFGRHYCWIMVPEHLFYYSQKSLKKLLKEAQFKKFNFSYPTRGNLNFSKSLANYLQDRTHKPLISNLGFFAFLPISILNSMIGSLFSVGEVVRVVARKSW